MSFTGDLEHLPIIDIVQLLHQTRKTGTLCLKSYKGESQLVFKDGYIVSANHHNNNIRIGRILVEVGAVTEEAIATALREQGSGEGRKPLVAILIENGLIDRKVAFRGLETLIELTIVEILTWKEGTFTLDISTDIVSDEYRYFPEKLHEELILDTENVLMDALRIYDERNRDGELVEDEWLNDDEAFSPVDNAADLIESGGLLTEEDLGLDNLDSLERKIPEVFTSLRVEDPAEVHRKIIWRELRDAADEERERLVSYLLELGVSHSAGHPDHGHALILFSRDELLRHAVTTAGRYEGFFVFTTDDAGDLDMIIEQTLTRERLPILVLDKPENAGAFVAESLTELRKEKLRKHPSLPVIQLVGAADRSFSLLALQDGVRAVFPKPAREEQEFVDQIMLLLDAFRAYVRQCRPAQERRMLALVHDLVSQTRGLTRAPDIALLLLKLTAAFFERSMTLVVNGTDLVAERSIGVKADRSQPSSALRFKIPINGPPSLFRDVIESGNPFFGQIDDPLLQEHLYPEIGVPESPQVFVAPFKCFGRAIALIYGDFGSKPPVPVETALIDMAAQFASLVLDNSIYRSRQEK